MLVTALDPDREKELENDEPPFLGSWTRIYGLVLGFLAFLIFVFHLFTKTYK